jgi:hypothetical protein
LAKRTPNEDAYFLDKTTVSSEFNTQTEQVYSASNTIAIPLQKSIMNSVEEGREKVEDVG